MNYEQFIAYFNTNDLCSSRIGVRLLSVAEGEATAALTLTDDCRNIMGNMHGGAIATLTDIVAGCAAYYHGRVCVTLDTQVRYLKGVREGTVLAAAKEVHHSNHFSICQVDVRNEEGALVSTCSITMYLTSSPVEDIMKPEDWEAIKKP